MVIEWNRVTWYSKLLAVIVFLCTFLFAFKLGILYKEVQILNKELVEIQKLDSQKISEDFILGINGSVNIAGMKITLLDVDSDSRCPRDVQCIWEGTILTTLGFDINNQSVIKEVSLGKELRFYGYTFTIKDVSPAKSSKNSISKEEYEITYHIEK